MGSLVNERKQADYKPEIYFLGQIVGGQDFPTSEDGLFVEASLVYGNEWELIDEKSSKALQTHTAYPDDEGFYIFAHPFDFYFIPESV